MKRIFSFGIYFLALSCSFATYTSNPECSTFWIRMIPPGEFIQLNGTQVPIVGEFGFYPLGSESQAGYRNSGAGGGSVQQSAGNGCRAGVRQMHAPQHTQAERDWLVKQNSKWQRIGQYQHWKKNDFERAALEKMRHDCRDYGESDIDWREFVERREHKFLLDHERYQLDEYRKYLETFPGYETYIVALHERMVKEEEPYLSNWGKVCRFMSPLWWDNFTDFSPHAFSTIVKDEYVRIKKSQEIYKENVEKARIKRAEESAAASVKKEQARLQAAEKLRLQEEYDREIVRLVEEKRAYVQQLHDKQAHVQENVQEAREYLDSYAHVYSEALEKDIIKKEDVDRYKCRVDAIKKSKENDFAFEIMDYTFSTQAADLLQASCIESPVFAGYDNRVLQQSIRNKQLPVNGSAIQHCIQQEIMTVLDKAADVRYAHKKNTTVQLFTDAIGQMSHVATESVQEGFVLLAMKVTDQCFKMLRCVKDNTLYAVVFAQEKLIETPYGYVKSGARYAKDEWREGTKDYQTGLRGYGVALVDGGVDAVEGFAELAEMGGSAFKAVEEGALTELVVEGVKVAVPLIVKGAMVTGGAVKCVGDGCYYAVLHPEEAYIHTKNNVAEAAKDLAELLYETSKLDIKNIAFDAGSFVLGETLEKIELLFDFAKDTYHDTTGQQMVRFGVRNVVEAGCYKKVGAVIGMFAKGAKAKLCTTVKAIPCNSNFVVAATAAVAASPEAVLVAETTEELIRLNKAATQAKRAAMIEADRAKGKAIKEATKVALAPVLAVPRPSSFTYIMPRQNHVLGLFACHRSGLRVKQYIDLIGTDNIKVTLKSLKHIFGVEVKRKCDKMGAWAAKVNGFHHDYKGRMSHLLRNKVFDKLGNMIEADIYLFGKDKNSTFFPSSWPPEKVLKSIQQALVNLIQEPIEEKCGKLALRGVDKSGMEIKIIVNKMGELVSAYPIWKK